MSCQVSRSPTQDWLLQHYGIWQQTDRLYKVRHSEITNSHRHIVSFRNFGLNEAKELDEVDATA